MLFVLGALVVADLVLSLHDWFVFMYSLFLVDKPPAVLNK